MVHLLSHTVRTLSMSPALSQEAQALMHRWVPVGKLKFTGGPHGAFICEEQIPRGTQLFRGRNTV